MTEYDNINEFSSELLIKILQTNNKLYVIINSY